ncbi:protein CHROMATIN REMODELING 24-like [Mercurialis annua]|uniref:protein CHROMATIN REMODELING 24-like n=1 Tax=Mercurialis annua TaxID=3986 RepID=UPI0024ADAF0F|nr:protein CHROMATIN REMODELING 24-like [Mercurialis annua]
MFLDSHLCLAFQLLLHEFCELFLIASDRDESLETDVKFLETLGIVGVSHHSLLFSKTAHVEEKEISHFYRKKQAAFVGNSSSTALERNIDKAEHSFNPKYVKLNKKSSSTDSVGKPTESDPKGRIRLSQLFVNKATISMRKTAKKDF